MIKELVRVVDRVITRLRGPGGAVKVSTSLPKTDGPRIRGFVTVRRKDELGRVVSETKGENIWTLYGREYLAQKISWHDWNGLRTNSTPEGELGQEGQPSPAVLYIGVGTGTGQLELAATSSLANAVPYTGTTYLKEVSLPPTFPSSGSVRYTVEFLKSEISLPDPVDVTEFGLYLDSATPSLPTNPPVAYKVMEPQPKTLAVALEIEWEVRFE